MYSKVSNKAVIYARYSSDSQREQSIEDQVKACQEYAARAGYEVIRVYSDKAKTGTNARRQSFQKMIKDSETGEFNAVICYHIDRFSRSIKDSLNYEELLNERGIKLLYATIEIVDGPTGFIQKTLEQAFAQMYSMNLSRNVRRGLYSNAEKCMANGVKVFGYDIVNNKYMVNEHQAKAIIKVFEMIINGEMKTDIVNYLNDNGFRNTNNCKFDNHSIYRMIRNRKYIGEYQFSNTVIPNGMPSIVNKDIFEKANEMLINANRDNMLKNSRSSKYLLSGVLFCGNCGSSMFGVSGTSKSGKKHYYYTCLGRKKGICDVSNINATVLENTVMNSITEQLFNDENLDYLVNGIYDAQMEQSSILELKNKRDELKKINKKIDNIMDFVESGNATNSMILRLEKLEEQTSILEHQIDKLEQKSSILDKSTIKKTLLAMKNRLFSSGNKRKILELLVQQAYLFNDSIVLVFNYSGNDNFIPLESIKKTHLNEMFELRLSGGKDNEKVEYHTFITPSHLIFYCSLV